MTARSFSPLLCLSAVGLLTLVTLAAPVGCGSTPPNVGGLCIADGGGCDPGLFCDTQIDGGYCTAPCSTQGSTDGCPEQSVCASISSGAGTECARTCNVQSDCRSDLECNGTTGSSVKVCKPKQ
jgi:hypothetical protein